ncbi:unnamed protein product [Arabidopsis halleri]
METRCSLGSREANELDMEEGSTMIVVLILFPRLIIV